MSPAAPDVVVAGLGMVSVLGTDVSTNCAAARAGINRASALDHFRVRSEVEGTAEVIIGHQASLLTRGFEGEARLVRLASGALVDLQAQCGQVDWGACRHRFYLSLPEARRLRSGMELVADEDRRRALLEEESARQEVERQAAVPSADAVQSAFSDRILRMAAVQARWPAAVARPAASFCGHAGGVDAVRAALSDLTSGAIDMAIVLAVDSYLDQETLGWLSLCGRLKCDGVPAGIQPGEAGAAIALRRREYAAGSELASIGAVSVDHEERALLSGAAAGGTALARVVGDCWDGAGGGVPWVITDHNGEVYRATDWAYALVRLRARFDAFADPIVWFPAAWYGETGAASALVAICTAVRAWERRYAPAPGAIIAAASDGGGRAAVVVGGRTNRS
jgi:3-oxoacyl-[acyl-carrier-protein] synthase-1